MMATLKKVDFMAGDDEERFESAIDKLREFAQLGYPNRELASACFRMVQETQQPIWALVAKAQK